jgi:hypothetical protein
MRPAPRSVGALVGMPTRQTRLHESHNPTHIRLDRDECRVGAEAGHDERQCQDRRDANDHHPQIWTHAALIETTFCRDDALSPRTEG